jgi:hypothetical protein
MCSALARKKTRPADTGTGKTAEEADRTGKRNEARLPEPTQLGRDQVQLWDPKQEMDNLG